MTKILPLTLALTIGFAGAAFAQNSSGSNNGTSSAPGQMMHDNQSSTSTSPGASGYAPGQQMQDDQTGTISGNSRGASSSAPGRSTSSGSSSR